VWLPVIPTENGWSMTGLMRTKEAAHALGVHPLTVTRWSREGHLVSVRTLGGHRRFSAEQIQAITAHTGKWLDHKPT
jgi:excisionase family DNA binding protein